jgi:hypothetical protein
MEVDSAVELGGGSVVFHGCSTSWLIGVQWTPVNVMLCGECWYHSPPVAQMITKIQKGLTGSIKLLQATRDGVSRSAVADYVISPACLSSGR